MQRARSEQRDRPSSEGATAADQLSANGRKG
jgi:hypothetical protein